MLERIAPLFEIEARINGQAPERRLAVRQAEAVALLADRLKLAADVSAITFDLAADPVRGFAPSASLNRWRA